MIIERAPERNGKSKGLTSRREVSLEKTAAVVIALGAVAVSHCVWSESIRSAEELSPLDPGVMDGQKTKEAAASALNEREPSIAVEAGVVPPSTVSDDASTPREGRDPSPSQTSSDWPGESQLALMAEDLSERTVRLWATEGFLSLTPEELRRLMPTPDGYDFTGPDNLVELLGGLPSEEECSRAIRLPRVQMLLVEAAKMDDILVDLEMIPPDRRPANYDGIVEAFDLQRNMIDDDLMATLDRSTGYPHWSLLRRLWMEFDR